MFCCKDICSAGHLLCLSSFFHSGLVCLCSLKNRLWKVLSCRQISSHRGQTVRDLKSTVDCWPRGAAVCTIVMLPVWNTMECLCLAPCGVAVRSVRFACATWTSSRSAVLCHASEHGYPCCERRCWQRSDRLHGGYTGTELGQGVQANSDTRHSVHGASRSVNKGLQCHGASLSLCTCLGQLHLHWQWCGCIGEPVFHGLSTCVGRADFTRVPQYQWLSGVFFSLGVYNANNKEIVFLS